MAKWVCERCGMRSRTPSQFEAHRAIHEQLPSSGDYDSELSDLAVGAGSVPASIGLPPSEVGAKPGPASTAAPDPRIDPFDIPAMPEFERASAPPPQPPLIEPEIISPAFSENDIAGMLRAIFDATAEMAGTGPDGRLSDAEARLLANLSRDWVNRQVASNFGNDPSQAKMLAAVGIIMATKTRVYVSAIKRKRRGESLPAAGTGSPNGAGGPAAPPPPESPDTIIFGDEGALGALS